MDVILSQLSTTVFIRNRFYNQVLLIRLSGISWPPRCWRKVLLNRQFPGDPLEADRQLMTRNKRLTFFFRKHYYLGIILQPDTVLIWIQRCNSRFDPLDTSWHYASRWTCRSCQLLCTTANQGPQGLVVMSLNEMSTWTFKNCSKGL